MISMFVSEGEKKDAKLLIETAKEIVAKLGDEQLKLYTVTEECPFESVLKTEKMDAAIVDVTGKDGVSIAKNLRARYPEIEILIVSDTTVSPILYLNPEVRAASLLLRPFQGELLTSTLTAFLALFEKEEADEYLMVEIQGGKNRIPYRIIRYLEARDRRIFVRLENVEYDFKDTLEHMEEVLPEEFLRCHRSYIVNHIFIESVRYSENYIILSGNHRIPLSRSYKSVLREAMRHA